MTLLSLYSPLYSLDLLTKLQKNYWVECALTSMRVSLLVIKPEILDFFYGPWPGKFCKVILDIIIDNFLRTGIGFFSGLELEILFFSHGNMWSLHFGESFCQSDIGHHRKEVTYRHSEEHYILSSAQWPQIEDGTLRI